MSRSTNKGEGSPRASAAVAHDGDELREQVRVLGDEVKELARLTKDTIGRKVEHAKDGAGAVLERGRDKVAEYGEQVADATRDHPLRSVMIAAGIGAVVGLIVGRR